MSVFLFRLHLSFVASVCAENSFVAIVLTYWAKLVIIVNFVECVADFELSEWARSIHAVIAWCFAGASKSVFSAKFLGNVAYISFQFFVEVFDYVYSQYRDVCV